MQFFPVLHLISGHYVTDPIASFFSSLSTSPPSSSEEENLLKRLESGGAVEVSRGGRVFDIFRREAPDIFALFRVC